MKDTIFNGILITLFIIIMFGPTLKMICSEPRNFSSIEKRFLAQFPSPPERLNQFSDYFSKIDAYINDHFGYRDFLIYRYQRELRKMFNIIGNDIPVYKGLNNWLYYTQSNMFLDFTGHDILSDRELITWVDSYEKKVAWLKNQGIEYLFIVPPNKQSIYPEFVSDNWETIRGASRLAQLRKAYAWIDKKELLNFSAILSEKKKDHALYYKSDTHWTAYGAYQAYLAIADKIEQKFPDVSFRKKFAIATHKKRYCEKNSEKCGDLTNMLLDHAPFEESFSAFFPFKRYAKKTNQGYFQKRHFFRRNPVCISHVRDTGEGW